MTPTPSDMCSGSCKGKRENCPCPTACGWPEDDFDAATLRTVLGLLTAIGLVIFCFGVAVWL